MNIVLLWIKLRIKTEICSVFSLWADKYTTTWNSNRISCAISKMQTIKSLGHERKNEEFYAFTSIQMVSTLSKKKHLFWRNGSGNQVVASCTPSDFRTIIKIKSTILRPGNGV